MLTAGADVIVVAVLANVKANDGLASVLYV